MCMSNLYVVEFDNGDKMTGSWHKSNGSRCCRIWESGGRLPGRISGYLTRLTHVTSC